MKLNYGLARVRQVIRLYFEMMCQFRAPARRTRDKFIFNGIVRESVICNDFVTAAGQMCLFSGQCGNEYV